HIGRASAFNETDVHSSWADFRIIRQRHIQQAMQCFNQFFDGGLAEVRISRVCHAPVSCQLNTESPFRGAPDLVLRRFPVYEEARTRRMMICHLRSLAVSLLAY